MFVGVIKNNVRQALTELINEGLVSDLVKQVTAAFAKQGVELGKDAKDLIANSKITYNFETKTVAVEFRKEF